MRPVGVADLAGAQRPRAGDQLVAGREHADPGPGVDGDLGDAPTVASTPRWAGVTSSPAPNTRSPGLMSSPTGRTWLPGSTADVDAHGPAVVGRSVRSTMHDGVGALGERAPRS